MENTCLSSSSWSKQISTNLLPFSWRYALRVCNKAAHCVVKAVWVPFATFWMEIYPPWLITSVLNSPLDVQSGLQLWTKLFFNSDQKEEWKNKGFTGDPRGSLGKAAIPYLLTPLQFSLVARSWVFLIFFFHSLNEIHLREEDEVDSIQLPTLPEDGSLRMGQYPSFPTLLCGCFFYCCGHFQHF